MIRRRECICGLCIYGIYYMGEGGTSVYTVYILCGLREVGIFAYIWV